MHHLKRSKSYRMTMGVAVVALLLVAIVLGTAGVAAAPGCAACHDRGEFAAATDSAAHGSLECAACHLGTGVPGRIVSLVGTAYHAVTAVAGRAEVETSAVRDRVCLDCHESIMEATVDNSRLKIQHAACTTGAGCTDCHSTTAHGAAVSWTRVYDMGTCLECHLAEASASCDECHAGKLPADRIVSGMFAVTHGPNWEQTHGMGNSATCSACHTAADCEACHGPGVPHDRDFFGAHSDLALAQGEQCYRCHHTRFCAGCHGLEMPHPATFIEEHPGEPDSARDVCARCHTESDCTGCHVTHAHPGGSVGALSGDGGEL